MPAASDAASLTRMSWFLLVFFASIVPLVGVAARLERWLDASATEAPHEPVAADAAEKRPDTERGTAVTQRHPVVRR
jgi:hypothetical protein